ncbi:MAG TPA: VWA domain-containing protein [Acidobacteriaceae bacterium]
MALRAYLRPTWPALLLAAFVAAAQGPVLHTPATASPAPATLSVDARLVNIPVVVRDKKGALVQTLTKDNFVLNVDDRPQTIRYFNVDKDLPLTLGLLVDTSLSQRDAIEDEQKASAAFLDDMLNGPPDRDKAFIIQFARQTELLQDTTSSKPKLQAGLKQLGTPGSGGGAQSGGGNGNPDGSVTLPDDSSGNGNGRPRMRGVGTTLYDALFLSSDELMSKLKGRKAVIILSDGVDSGSKETLSTSIEAAQRADTIVYAIYYKGRELGYQDRGRQGGGGYPGRRGGGGYPGGGGGYPGSGGGGGGQRRPQQGQVDGRKMLQRMADETGGRLFEVSKKETVADIYKQIGEELRAQYRLGYSPDKDTAADGYHRIDLSLSKATGKEKDFFLQTRDGYYVGH